MEAQAEVTISKLTKNFGEICAVDHMDLQVPMGSIFGLLGPNGAGKSTTVRLLCTLLKPAEGTATVAGYDILESPVQVREVTGIMPEEGNHTLYPGMSAYDNLQYFARLYSVDEEEIPGRIQDLLEFMDLWERKDSKAGELSTGNRQRLALCRALLHQPKVLLLDEPTAALDPVAAKRVRELILSLSHKYGQTFFINSHNLAEVQRICDRVAIIDDGKIILEGEMHELRGRLRSKQEFRIRVAGDVKQAVGVLEQYSFVTSVSIEVDSLLAEIHDPIVNNTTLIRALLDAGVKIVEFAEEEMTLEDLYLDTILGGAEK
ncbi:MAG: ABC transporter ATP-binding protein [Candidatus Thorarchaeota archaeon]|nr:ABC transporter ATP-binding protein [Candidatus Thorarchaeota archaeon]